MKRKQITSILLSFVLVASAFCAPFAQVPAYAAEEASANEGVSSLTEEKNAESSTVGEDAGVSAEDTGVYAEGGDAFEEETDAADKAQNLLQNSGSPYDKDAEEQENAEDQENADEPVDADPQDNASASGSTDDSTAPGSTNDSVVPVSTDDVADEAQGLQQSSEAPNGANAAPSETDNGKKDAQSGDFIFKGVVSATTEGQEAVPEDNSSKSSDDLFADYVDSSFSIQTSQNGQSSNGRKRAPRSAASGLTGVDRMIYDEIARYLPAIASGERALTVFEISVDDIGLEKTFWTTGELGIDTLFTLDENGNIYIDENGNATISSVAVDAVSERTAFDLSKILHALLADHPYELYWYEKTQETEATGYEITAFYDDTVDDYVAGAIGSFTISFPVSTDYSAGEYTVDTSFGQTVQTSVENANNIVDQYSDGTDYEKLCGYREEICALASYNYPAAEGGVSYGNPWQLIWVFDGDPATEVVCEGYAKAYKYLCDQTDFDADISCITVTGTMDGGTGEGDHMWNIVNMEGVNNYLVDVTNSDEGTVGEPDLLFLAGTASGDVETGYVFDCIDETVLYQYDEETLGLYGQNALTIAQNGYDPATHEENGVKIVTHPSDVTAKNGQQVTFTVGAEGEDLSYQWQWSADGTTWKNCSSSGYNTDTLRFVMRAAYDGRHYRCQVTSGDEQVMSEEAVVTYKEALKITSQPLDVAAAGGESVSVHVKANRDDAAYRWQWSADGKKWKDCTSAGCNTDTFSFIMKGTLNGRHYRCVVTSGDEQVTSAAAVVYCTTGEALEITSQPQDVTAPVGAGVSVHVEANKADAAYKWQWSADGKKWKDCTSAGCNTDTFSFAMKDTLNGRHYRCVVTSGSEQVMSAVAVVYCEEDDTIKITSQPQNVTAGDGVNVSFHVATEQTGVIYQWQWSADGKTWKNCSSSGYNTDTMHFVMRSKYDGRQYRCILISGVRQVISNAVTVAFGESLKITSQPEDVAAADGENVNIHVEVNKQNVKYQWQWSADGKTWKNCSSAGYNTDAFHFMMRETYSGRQYRCVITWGTESVTTTSALLTYADVHGSCGDNAIWSIDFATGTLTISGTGDMWDYYVSRPWDDYKQNFNKIIVQGGIIHLGNSAFSTCGNITSVELPDSLTSIGEFAFHSCYALTQLSIPSAVTSIGQSAFNDCTSLTSITIPDSITRIYPTTFCYCYNLESINIPEGVTRIDRQAFYYCQSLTSIDIPDSVTYIGLHAFEHCESLTDLYIPANVEIIDEHALEGCYAMTDISVSPDNSVYSSDDGILYDKALETLIMCPAGRTKENVNIPDSVTRIRSRAFFLCSHIKNVNIPNLVTRIDADTFWGCESLSGIDLHDGVTAIDEYAFYDSGITSVTFTSNLTTIGKSAFECCDNLEICYYDGTIAQWQAMEVGENNNSLTQSAIIVCSDGEITPNISWDITDGVFTLYGEGETDHYSWVGDDGISAPWSDRRDEITKVVISEGITGIYGPMFAMCFNLTEVSLPSTLKTIGGTVFDTCLALETITIPEGVESIGGSAFWSCYALKTIWIPGTVNSFGRFTFAACPLTDIYFSGTAGQWQRIEWLQSASVNEDALLHFGTAQTFSGDLGYELADGECTITSYKGSDTTVTIPDTIGGYPVTEVNFSQFNSDGTRNESVFGITEIHLPNSVVKLGEGAFRNLYGLKTITGLDAVQYVGDYCFSGSGVESLEFSAALSWAGLYAFDANELRSITIPDTLRWEDSTDGFSGTTPFRNHEKLETIELIETGDTPLLTMVGPGLYTANMIYLVCYPCKNPLRSYSVPDGVYGFYPMAFDIRDINNTDGLYEVSVPASVGGMIGGFFDGLYVDMPDGTTKNVILPRLIVEEGSCAHEECVHNDGKYYWRLADS